MYVSNSCVLVCVDVLEVNGLTLDTASRLLFWTDAQRRHIQVATYDGARVKTIVRDGLITPRGVTADVKNKCVRAGITGGESDDCFTFFVRIAPRHTPTNSVLKSHNNVHHSPNTAIN